MTNEEMKILIIGDTEYEIVDEASRNNIGDLTALNTDTKANLVTAINEHELQINSQGTDVGDLDDLNTTAKSSVIAAINELDTEKADSSTVYTKTEANNLLDGKVSLNRIKTVRFYPTASASVPEYGQPANVTFHTDDISESNVIAFLGIVGRYMSSVLTLTRFEFELTATGANLNAYLAVVPSESYSAGSGSFTVQTTDYIEVSYISSTDN